MPCRQLIFLIFGLCPRFGLSPNRGLSPKIFFQPPAWQSHASHRAAKPQRACQIHNRRSRRVSTPANAGGTDLFQVRKPSLVSQRYQRIDFRGASRGQVARAYADDRQTQRNHYERDFVIRRDSKQ